MCLVVPIAFNSGLAFSMLMREINKNAKFQEWFSQHVRIVSILTLIAGADVEVVTLLGSNFAGLKMFSAPLSKTTLNQVFWGGALNLFIEDIPQLVIQVCENGVIKSEWYEIYLLTLNLLSFTTDSV